MKEFHNRLTVAALESFAGAWEEVPGEENAKNVGKTAFIKSQVKSYFMTGIRKEYRVKIEDRDEATRKEMKLILKVLADWELTEEGKKVLNQSGKAPVGALRGKGKGKSEEKERQGTSNENDKSNQGGKDKLCHYCGWKSHLRPTCRFKKEDEARGQKQERHIPFPRPRDWDTLSDPQKQVAINDYLKETGSSSQRSLMPPPMPSQPPGPVASFNAIPIYHPWTDDSQQWNPYMYQEEGPSGAPQTTPNQ